MSVTEVTTLIDGVQEISRTERKLFTLAELKEGDSAAFDRACSWMIQGEMEWDWWESTLDCEVDYIKETYGFTYNPKDVSFDIDRGDYFCFGKVTDLDDKKYMRKAGIDLRRRGARECIDRLVIGVRHYYNDHNWIGFYEYERVPEYIEKMYPGITDMLETPLRDAGGEMLKNLRAEQEYLTSEGYLLERAMDSDLLFDARGNRA